MCHTATKLKRVKFPKPPINRVFGEQDKFWEFWNQFELYVDKNPSLTEIKKIT